MKSGFEKAPFIAVSGSAEDCRIGWADVLESLRGAVSGGRTVICVECYPGVMVDEVERALTEGLRPSAVYRAHDCWKSPEEVEAMVARDLTDDPVFGRMNGLGIADFFDPRALAHARDQVAGVSEGVVLVVGTGAALLCPEPDLLVYADLARWEIQQRQRRNEIGNLGADNSKERPSLKYKRAFFVDWRAADRLKKKLLPRLDYLLDTNDRNQPRLITGAMFRRGLREALKRPFSVVPFFDPGPWGGQWMKTVFGLPEDAPNYAWCFNCVPEENSLLLGFGHVRVEIPSIDLVFLHPRELLGEEVYARFGAEFPIRFDFLDTMEGGNLSLQVHPLTGYIQDKFGVPYTQDESYYLLDAAPDGTVFLGLREGIDPATFFDDLTRSEERGQAFPVDKYVNQWPARKHDHFLIPAGTIHCSGRNTVVLEVSATPYIFTFKLWDWNRLGLDGRPRPVHLAHGRENIQWDRTTGWVRRNLINRVEPLAAGPGWREERTGLHELEFIETRRCWFTGTAPHDTEGGVHVVNLVEGDEVVVESPTHAFEPFVVHYAETFIVPAAVGPYTIRPHGPGAGKRCATLQAFVRKCS